MKISKCYIVYLCSVLSVVVLVACTNSVQSETGLTNFPSEAECLVTEKTYKDYTEWKWLDSSVAQSSHVNSKTGQKYKQVVSLLTGLYGESEDYMKINSAIDLYDQSLNISDLPAVSTPGANYILFSTDFLEIGNRARFSCAKEQNQYSKYTSFNCEYEAVYEKIVFHLYVSGPSSMNKSDVEGIVNPVLPFIDACISDL